RLYFSRPADSPAVVAGVGDDGAVLPPPAGRELVTVIDTRVAGTHFPPSMNARDTGYRSVAVNLSDIAAMGAEPRWMTLALTLAEADADWLGDFAEGLYEAAAEWGVALVGGDTTRGDQLVVSVQISGDLAPGTALYRSGAKAGDTVFVTGTLGDAAAGLERLSAGAGDEYLVRRFTRPSARVGVGRALAGIAHAAIDLSDGLVADVSKLIEASRVGAELDLQRLPLSPELLEAAGREQALQHAMAGGDDYELCFALPASKLPADVAAEVTPIGRITREPGLVCRDGNSLVPVDDAGYRHFQ
ncbi:MAG TPA: thiamine-phosphate kinase, partial [Woeseiaceae bacterium]|nr:thiamine-phosphate kinase [Woeseiaceae bacterium]